MKILYISSLPNTMSGGPKYSVPKQVNAQAQFDDVSWINISPWGVEDSTVPCECILKLNEVFNRISQIRPELVVFEDLYYIEFYIIGRYLHKNKCPYIIVPRGCLTKAAQWQKRYKKLPANLLLFSSFANRAIAIEFLTQNELENSGNKWNKTNIIVPNGTDIPSCTARPNYENGYIQGTFIGRINLYHKGLDILFDACLELRDILEKKNVVIDLYGPYSPSVGEMIAEDLHRNGMEKIIRIHEEVHGEVKEQILVHSDFFILTSRFEGLPMGLLEALSYGLPCLVTNETNIGKLIADRGAGFSSLCNKTAIKNNLLRILDLNNSEANDMSDNAKKIAREFDWIEIARVAHDKYIDLLK